MTEAIAAVEAAETVTTETTTETAGKPAEAVVSEKAADTPAKGADATGEAAGKAGEADKGEGDDRAKPDEFSWPDDWRERLAGDDEDLAKILKRFTSPATFARKIAEQDKLIKSTRAGIAPPMPDAKDEKAMSEWRKAQGIPDDPSGYVLPEPITKRMVDDDKPILANFAEFAHKSNMPPVFVEKAAEWYVETQELAAEKQQKDDKQWHEDCEDALRKDLPHGAYKETIGAAHSFLESVPGLSTDFATARLPNGKMLVQDPAFILWAAEMAIKEKGDMAFVGGDREQKHTARRAEIEKIRDTDFDRYEAEGMDKEYRAIIEKDLKRGKR